MDDALLDLAAPPTLPALTERAATAELVYAGAGVARLDEDGNAAGAGFLWLSHLEGEVPLGTRAWHAGVAWDVASSAAAGKERSIIWGNPELWARAVGWHESGLAGEVTGAGAQVPSRSRAALDMTLRTKLSSRCTRATTERP